MSRSHLVAVRFDAHDPQGLAQFWAGVLGWDVVDDPHDDISLVPNDGTGFRLRFHLSEEKKENQNKLHFDLTTTSLEEQQHTVAVALELGGRHCDVGQGPEELHVVLADPEGNEFCVLEPGNTFLADCGFLAALNCDGTRQVGYFWSEALGWPLVWDQDEETAIQSPQGGRKITWSGPPLIPKKGPNRLRFDLAAVEGDVQDEVTRLVNLGATRLGSGEYGRVEMADPDGNEFAIVAAAPRAAPHTR